MNKHKTGLIFGSFLGFWHLLWSLLVLTGLAQPFLDFIFWLHMIKNPYQVEGFSLGRALGLIVTTFVIGYIFGSIIAWIANKIQKPQM